MSRISADALVKKYGAAQLRKVIASLSAEEAEALEHDWSFWARDKQLPPLGDWRIWLLLAGRGWGKTLVGAQWVRSLVEANRTERIALVGATSADVRDTMIEGPSGLLNVFPPDKRPHYETSKRRVTFHNGAVALCYSADEPERLRGPNFSAAWTDEICAWSTEHAWDQLMLCLRAGANPKVCVTTTPKPTPLIVSLTKRDDVVITTGSTFENTANLAPSYVENLKRTFEGTRLGRQEIYAEVLLDVPGALFRQDLIDAHRVHEPPGLERVVVAVDPAPTSADGSDMTGIVVVGKANDSAYVLEDLSQRDTPDAWARAAIAAYYKHRADCVVAERNRGGDMIKALIQTIDNNVPVKEVTAMRGKFKRAEPVAGLYEQGRVKHCGSHDALEKQMTVFSGEPGKRDDRVDTLCWGVHEVLLSESPFFLL